MSALISKRLLQAVVAVLGLVPVAAGAAGVLAGPDFMMAASAWPIDLDSHFRYLSGIFLAIGLMFYASIPGIERKTALFRLAALPVVIGGFARLGSLLAVGTPSNPHVAGLILELGLMPTLLIWQASVAHRTPARGWHRTSAFGR